MKPSVGMTSVVLALAVAMVATSIGLGNGQSTSEAGTICVVAYNDKSHNGAQGSGEPRLPGWHFRITDAASGKAVGRLTSSAGKKVCIGTNGPGQFAVSQVTQPGWTPTTPRLGTATVAVVAGETQVVRFGSRYSSRMAPVCVVTYSDKNDNGRQDAGEPALPGRRVVVKDRNTHQTVSTLATVRGKACAKVLPGNYTVVEASNSGSVPTLPTTSRQDVTAAVGVTQVLKFGDHVFKLDHFECYSVDGARRQPLTVGLTDEFGPRSAQVTSRQRLCNPVSKNDERVKVPAGHLVCYAVAAGEAPDETVLTSDQFGENSLKVGAPRRLCLPSGKALKGSPDGPPAGLDHYLCYDATPVEANRYKPVGLADQFWTTNAKVLAPSQLCTPVRKDRGAARGTVVNSSDHLVCYTIKASGFSPRSVAVKNQFETQRLRVTSPEDLCLPALARVEEAADQLVAACDDGDIEAPAGSVAADGYVDSNNGPIENLYPSEDTSLDTWYQHDTGCDWSIGGDVPPAALDAGVDGFLKDVGPGTSARDVITDLGKVESQVLEMAKARPEVPSDLPPVVYCEPTAASKTCQYTQPANPPALTAGQPFGGRDIIFVHGIDMGAISDKISIPNSGAQSKWPGDPTEFTASNGYWKQKADTYWAQHIAQNLGSVTSPSNRYLTIAWPSTQWLIYGAHALLTQTARAMNDGTGVVPTSNGDKSGFCARGCVIVSHSTGGPLVDVAMSIAGNTQWFGDLKFIPDHMRAHVAFAGAFAGSGYATPVVALGVAAGGVGALCQLGVIVANLLGASLSGCGGFGVVLESVLVDLVPPVMTTVWRQAIDQTPVPTLTVASGHPSAYGALGLGWGGTFLKWLLHRGFDDGVVTMNSTCANPATATLPVSAFPGNIGWPSGYVAKPTVVDTAINTNLGLIVPPAYPLTPVVIRAYDMFNAVRGIGFYLDQVGDRYLVWFLNPTSPVNSEPYYVGAGCTPFVAPNGMVQPVAIQSSLALWATKPDTLPFGRYQNHYSFLQSTGEHGGFEQPGPCYLGYFTQSAACKNDDKLNNTEEVRVVTNPYVYAPLPGCAPNDLACAPLLSGDVKHMVEEQVKGLPLCKRWKWCKRIWIWKRVFHRMIGWETKTEADYVYQYVLQY